MEATVMEKVTAMARDGGSSSATWQEANAMPRQPENPGKRPE